MEVKVLQQKITEWEGTILPCIVEHLPGIRALPTPESEDEPMHDADRDLPVFQNSPGRRADGEASSGQQDNVQRTDEGGEEVRPVEHASVIASMEQISFRQCCQRVVQSSDGPRRAIRPFRA